MGKISPISTKYIIIAKIELSSIAEKPDVIGAIFGQTEGLLGSGLELRELQKTGKIGRIEVNLKNIKGKTEGEIQIPSSLGKSETSIIAASLETIDRVGPCNAKITVKNIQDVREIKRDFIKGRAEELLRSLLKSLPDSQEFTNVITQVVRTRGVIEYGADKLPAGPMVDNSDELIIVEGRADVLNLLKYNIKNVIALNGAKTPRTIIELAKKKKVTLFIDGDRGGDLIARTLLSEADIDYIAKAPDGKEVEELTMKEIQKALRAKVPVTAKRAKLASKPTKSRTMKYDKQQRQPITPGADKFIRANVKVLMQMSEDLIGTHGAFLLDPTLKILGRVPISELLDTLENISEGAFAIIMDGAVDTKLARSAEKRNIKYIIAKSSTAGQTRVRVITSRMLQQIK